MPMDAVITVAGCMMGGHDGASSGEEISDESPLKEHKVIQRAESFVPSHQILHLLLLLFLRLLLCFLLLLLLSKGLLCLLC